MSSIVIAAVDDRQVAVGYNGDEKLFWRVGDTYICWFGDKRIAGYVRDEVLDTEIKRIERMSDYSDMSMAYSSIFNSLFNDYQGKRYNLHEMSEEWECKFMIANRHGVFKIDNIVTAWRCGWWGCAGYRAADYGDGAMAALWAGNSSVKRNWLKMGDAEDVVHKSLVAVNDLNNYADKRKFDLHTDAFLIDEK